MFALCLQYVHGEYLLHPLCLFSGKIWQAQLGLKRPNFDIGPVLGDHLFQAQSGGPRNRSPMKGVSKKRVPLRNGCVPCYAGEKVSLCVRLIMRPSPGRSSRPGERSDGAVSATSGLNGQPKGACSHNGTLNKGLAHIGELNWVNYNDLTRPNSPPNGWFMWGMAPQPLQVSGW